MRTADSMTLAPGTLRRPTRHRRLAWGLALVAGLALVFVADAALPYARLRPEQFGPYWPRRWGLLLHIVPATVALLAGPVQLWLGVARRHPRLHRRLGRLYAVSIAISALAAYYLVATTTFGWVFGAGLGALATAWLLTSGLALWAIRRRQIEQHREWAIRSYVVTSAFVVFRALFALLQGTGVGTTQEQLALLAWACWTLPLLLTEALLQGRKILASKAA